MKTISVLAGILLLMLTFAPPVPAAPLAEGVALLQAKDYAGAAAALAAVPEGERENGYAEWLRALALYGGGKTEEAVAACDAVAAGSPWAQKARLLKARALTDRKEFAAAEEIYAAAAAQALSPARKDELAGLLVDFADELMRVPAPGEVDAVPADPARAAVLYQRALETEFLTPGFLEDTLYKLAVVLQQQGQPENALRVLDDLLVQFDKAWTPLASSETNAGAPGSVGPAREKPRDAKRFLTEGRHVHAARLRAAECQMALTNAGAARATAERLLALQPPPDSDTARAAAWLRCQTFADGGPLGRREHNEALTEFLAAHPDSEHAPEAARLIAANLLSENRVEEGIVALEAFIEGKNYQFDPASEANRKTDEASGLSPAEALEQEKRKAFYQTGKLEYDRDRFEAAITRWRAYTVNYPNGAQWADAQKGIIDAEFQMGIAAVAAGDEALARERLDAFLTRYPLDQRARQILFIYGQFAYAAAQVQELAAREQDASAALPEPVRALFLTAVEQWARLITKYPETEESSLALYNTALILTEKTGRMEEGLAAFRRLTWGQWAAAAKERAAILEEKSLAISAARVFRTNEVPQLSVSVRNIRKLKVSRYALDLEGWLRSAHRLGGLEKLDVDLIAPEKTWEVEVADYAPLRALQQQIALPFPDNKPGACVVRVEGDDWQASTLVVRSDIELITEATGRELLVFALNALENQPAAGATVLVSDGTKIMATGKTGEDGVFRHLADDLPDTVRAFVLTPRGAMVSGLDLAALTVVKQPETATVTSFDRDRYFTGQTARFVIVRRKLDGVKVSPEKGKVTLRVLGPDKRLVMSRAAEWAADGSIRGEFRIPADAPAGTYPVQLLDAEERVFVKAEFTVHEEPVENTPRLSLKLDRAQVLPGGKVEATLFAEWPWGLPVGEEPVEISYPDGRTARLETDSAGVLRFAFTATTGQIDNRSELVKVVLPRQGNAGVTGQIGVVLDPWLTVVDELPPVLAAGEALPLRLRSIRYDRAGEARALSGALYRLAAPPPSRVLEGVPWIRYSAPAVAEEKVEEFTVSTDPVSGRAERSLTIANGGHYLLRLRGADGALVNEQRIYVSGGNDPHGLRLFTGADGVNAGGTLQLQLQSQKEHRHVLLTVITDRFLTHEIRSVPPGMTGLSVPVSAEHTPAFRITAATLDGRELQAASLAVPVRSGVRIVMKPGDSPAVAFTDPAGPPVEVSAVTAMVPLSPDADALAGGSEEMARRTLLTTRVPWQLRLAVHTSGALLFPGTSVKVNPATGGAPERQEAVANDQERLLDVQKLELGNNSGNSLLFFNTQKFASMNCFVQIDAPRSAGTGPLYFAEGVIRPADAWVQSVLLPAVPDAMNAQTRRPPLETGEGLPGAPAGRLFVNRREPIAEPASPDPGGWPVSTGSGFAIPTETLTSGRWSAVVRAWTPDGGMLEASMPVVVRNAPAAPQAGPQAAASAGGLRHAVVAGGVLTGADSFVLELPPVREGSAAGAGLVFATPLELVKSLAARDGEPQAKLLAVATAIERLRRGSDEEKAEAEMLVASCRDLVSEVVLAEVSGGWAWGGLAVDPDLLTTAETWWALDAAKRAGITVSEKLEGRVLAFLTEHSTGIPADDYEKKAAVLHALALLGRADYASAASILRARDELSDCALAFLTAALIRMERPDEARELLAALGHRAVKAQTGQSIAAASWSGSEKVVRLSEPELVTAMSLWCYARLEPGSANGAAAVNWLLSSRVMNPAGGSLSSGPVTVALDAWFQGANDWTEPGTMDLEVNGNAVPAGRSGRNEIKVAAKNGKPVIFSVVLTGVAAEVEDRKPWAHPEIFERTFYHEALRYGDDLLGVRSSSPVRVAETGQRVRVDAVVQSANPDVATHPQYLVWDEALPAGFAVVPGSVESNADKVEILPGLIRLSYAPGVVEALRYELVALVPGEVAVPPSLIRDAYDPARYRPGKAAVLTVLPAGQKSPDRYEMNQAEHFALAKRTFDGGDSAACLTHLEALAPSVRKAEYEKDLARMKLWLLTDQPDGDAAQIVAAFETLNARHPGLVVPFDRILRVGAAYQKIGEHERGSWVFRAALEAAFLTDSAVGAALEDGGDYAGSVDFQERLWREAPDSEDPRRALFALSQSLFQKAGEAEALPVRRGQAKLDKTGLLTRSRDLLLRFLTVYPADELADDAAFSLTNAFFALKDYAGVVSAAAAAVGRDPDSPYAGRFHYMAALGHFWQFHYAEALASAAPVANGESKDRDLARYITGQIYHAEGRPEEAVGWYRKVREMYSDAADSLAAFEEKKTTVPEIATFAPGAAVQLRVNHRNVKEVSLQIYRVDLMKLYLREKNLSRVTRVNLAGIAPEAEVPVDVRDAAPWRDHEVLVDLPMKEEGAYLVIARGDDLFTSGLVLITALELEVREEEASGSVRVNVRSAADGKFVADAEVKAIAGETAEIQSGRTDPRGIFEAAGLRGMATVIVRQGENRFAFHRGSVLLAGAAGFPVTPTTPQSVPRRRTVLGEFDPAQIMQEFDPPQIPQSFGGKVLSKDAYLENLNSDNREIQDGNWKEWDSKRRSSGKGVQADKALKK